MRRCVAAVAWAWAGLAIDVKALAAAVWQNFNDASRRTDSWFGAAGGWFRLWETDVVFYFWHLWPPGHVEQCNIAELELQAAMIALHLQLEVHEQLFGRNSPHYTLVAGDNSSISDYCPWFSRSCLSPNCIKWDSPGTRQSFALWFPQTSCSTLAGLLLLVACWGKSS